MNSLEPWTNKLYHVRPARSSSNARSQQPDAKAIHKSPALFDCLHWGQGSLGTFCPLLGQASDALLPWGEVRREHPLGRLPHNGGAARYIAVPHPMTSKSARSGIQRRPVPKEATLASPTPVPREAKVARGTPVPGEDIWHEKALRMGLRRALGDPYWMWVRQ